MPPSVGAGADEKHDQILVGVDGETAGIDGHGVLAAQGFETLRAAALAAMKGLADPKERLDAYGVAYVRHAIEHPAHHRVMFAAELHVSDDLKQTIGAGAFDLLVETASAASVPGVDPLEAAVTAWSLSHGLSMLILDGRIPREHIESVEAVERLARRVFALSRGELPG